MKVARINRFFARFGEFQLRHRWAFIICLAAVTAACFCGLPRLRLEQNEEDWFPDWDQVRVNQDHFEDIFGNDDSVMVLVQADDVFAPQVLDAIDRLGRRLEQEVPYAKRVTSLMTLSVSQGTEDGFDVVTPFEDGVPADPAELAEKKAYILSRESLVNSIVSDDAKETWVVLALESYDIGLEEAEILVGRAARDVIMSDEFRSDGWSLKATGMSYTENEENEAVTGEVMVRIGIGFIVMLLCLILFLRSLRGVAVPFLATTGAIGSVLGAMSFLGIAADSTLVALPVLLAMALSVGYSVHCVNAFRMHFRTTGRRRQSVIRAVEDSGWPILFTVVTTVASLLSFLTAGIGPIKWVGACSACTVFAVYLYVIICIPIFLSFGKDGEPQPGAQETRGATKADRAFEAFGRHVVRHAIPVVAASAVIVASLVPGIFRMQVNMDYTEMMGEKIPYVARLKQIMQAKLGSQYSYDVMIEYDDEDAFKDPQALLALDELSARLGTLPLTRVSVDKPRVTSVTGNIKEMNRAMNGDDPAFYAIPEDGAVLAEMVTMMAEVFMPEEMEAWLDDEYRTTHVHVELNGYDATQIVADLEAAKGFAADIFPGAHAAVIGLVVNYAEMNGKLVTGELRSFAGSFAIILLLLIIAFSSVRTGLIGMMPNIAPVVAIGGIMGYCHFSLDMLTMTVMPMILGIAVDDTIHLTNHIKLHLEQTGRYRESVERSFREIGKTMGMTTFILCAMFLVFLLSPMTCLHRIGLLSIIGLGSALVADYTLTPALICLCRSFGPERAGGTGNGQE